jgi:hypothetical protein
MKTVYNPTQNPLKPQETFEHIATSLEHLKGKLVRVAIVEDGITRNHFGPQIAVCGHLEIKTDEAKNPHYRVLHNDECFAYFTPNEVLLVNTLTRFPTITLSIPTEIQNIQDNDR